ncbi:hypothetical protein OH77DRAFT_1439433 [Trametes cingulata]|nr:hypothetical protein OH77DRAFT_1439433 [Trametes cingulata]
MGNDPPLPLELWHLIIQLLPNTDQRTCLFVSKTFRDIARSFLFSSVTIYFGVWKPNGEHIQQDDALELVRHETWSWDMLRYMTRDAAFAKVVKRLFVRSYSTGMGVFEINAIESLPNLLSFRWDGDMPRLNPHVMHALARTSGTTLTELHAPIASISGYVIEHFPLFTKLEALALTVDFFDEPVTRLVNSFAVRTCVDAVSHTLRRLHVGGDTIWMLPIRTFMNLQELVVQEPKELGSIGLVFRHCAQLESLTLVLDNIWVEKFLNTAMEENPDALPNLTSFKLICHGDSFNRYPRDILDFLRPKKRLRRLHVETNMDSADEGLYPQFYEFLPEFPKLEVVGTGICGFDFTPEKLKLLDEKIPMGVNALLITFDFESTEVPQSAWMDMFRKRTSMGYLHILDREETLGMKQQLLEDHPPSLKLTGYGPYLRWIEQDPDTWLPAYAPSWPPHKVKFRTVEDFGCEDWDWLLRHRDWGDINSLHPGLRDPGPGS